MNINDFKTTLSGGGARANHFSVQLSMPSYATDGRNASQQAQFLCHSASMPASTLQDIPVPYRGREVHIAGERTFEPWTISIYNDTDFVIRRALESWIERISNTTQVNGLTNPRDYQMQMQVYQLDRNGAVIKQYNFINAYPTQLSETELSYDAGSAIEQFQVTFTYDYWTTDITSRGVGSLTGNDSIAGNLATISNLTGLASGVAGIFGA